MLTKIQLADQLKLQDRMNSTVNPTWLQAGYPWMRAVMVEGVEALDHLGWKWWKKIEPDVPQARIELVDIWHFVLSNELSMTGGDHAEAATNISVAFRYPQFQIDWRGRDIDMRHLDQRDLLHIVVGMAAQNIFCYPAFTTLMEQLEFPWDQLHSSYVGKNVLNMFRQANGYKAGTYQKDWDGHEDNVVLEDLLTSAPDADTLYQQLEIIYKSITKEKTQ